MKLKTVSLIVALFFSNHFTNSYAGTGVKNGGSGYLCDTGEIILAEHLLASRSSSIHPIDDRDEFFNRVLKKISSPILKQFLTDQWNHFGDSTQWPLGDASQAEVYFHEGAFQMTRFDTEGKIPPQDPSNLVCEFPAYEPELCCVRILISYFDRSENKPHRILQFHDQLTRYQKNVLELHEAVYKMTQKLGKLQPISIDPAVDEIIRSHMNSVFYTGEIPSSVIHSVVTQMLIESKNSSHEDLDLQLNRLWQWSNRIYP